jgi:putative DNA primase/helicase
VNPARILFAAGARDLHPVIPPGATLSSKSRIKLDQVGKIPGLRNGRGKWHGYNWREAQPATQAALTCWLRDWNASIGLRARNFPGVDIDVLDPELAAAIQQLAFDTLGPAPVRVGNPPKALLPYRLAGEPFTKIVLDLSKNGAPVGKIEVLGDGQQYVVEGIHPKTQRPYTWDREPTSLTPVTREKIEAFLDALRTTLKARGYTVLGEERRRSRGTNTEPDRAPSLELVREAVRAIPNEDQYTSRDEWLRIIMAIKGACEGTDFEEHGEELAQEWSTKWPGGNDPEYVATTYRENRPKSGWHTLRAEAEKHGAPLALLEAIAAFSAAPLPDLAADSATRRPVIRIRPELNAVTDEAINAINARPDLGVYSRGRQVVEVTPDNPESAPWLRREGGAPVIATVNEIRMRALMDAAAQWLKRSRNGWVPAMPPSDIAAQILARTVPPFRPLVGVIDSPTLRPDGSLITEPGWDPVTGLLYAPLRTDWPAIPENPTREDAQVAVATLLEPVRDFPFKAETDRAAFVAVILTLIGRHLIAGPTPWFVIGAPTPATGKSLLTKIIGLIGTGREPPATSLPSSRDELSKHILSVALEGRPLILLDNLAGVVSSDTLAGILTASSWSGRLLGQNVTAEVPLNTVWLGNGNNLTFGNTLGRRVIPIDMDAGMESPEDRDGFKYPDLAGHVGKVRPQLVAAALTLLKGFLLAGRPGHGKPKMGSYEAWDDLIRAVVIWAGLDDPAGADDPSKARGRIRAAGDDDRERYGALLTALAQECPEGFTSAEALQRGQVSDTLRSALDGGAGGRQGRVADSRSLGNTLRALKDRPVNGFVLRRRGVDRNGIAFWKVEAAGSAGSAGSDSNEPE